MKDYVAVEEMQNRNWQYQFNLLTGRISSKKKYGVDSLENDNKNNTE